MLTAKHAVAGVALIACLLPASAPASTAAGSSTTAGATTRALLRSRELWATIDVCNPPDQPNTVGVRGSMPGDGEAHQRMYMSFRLQYLDSAAKDWVDLASGSSPTFIPVGAAASPRQGGRSFQLVPVPGKPAVTLRGVVSFQWRRGKTVTHRLTRATSAGHMSLAGADPAGASTATCLIG
jgi:hypothetical protein